MNHDHYINREIEIENALLNLMETLPYSKISISDISDRIQVVRKTFYNYFPNKAACLQSLIDRHICDCNLSILQLPENPTQYDQFLCRINYWVQNKQFLDAIIQNDFSDLFVERIMIYIAKEYPEISNNTNRIFFDDDVLFFYMTGEVFLLLKWCAEDFPLSLDEMTRTLLRLTHEPLYPKQ